MRFLPRVGWLMFRFFYIASQLPLVNRRKAFLSTYRTLLSFLVSMPLVKQNAFALAAIIQPSILLATPRRQKG